MLGNLVFKLLKLFSRRNGRHGDFFRTVSGRKFWPLDPRLEDLDIEDMAHSLAYQCRFAGHTDTHYSIAEHSVRGSYYLDTCEEAFAFLLHDSPEAYLVDLPRPIKRTGLFGWLYCKYEEQLWRLIARYFGLPLETTLKIKVVDNRMLATEKRDVRKLAGNTQNTEGNYPYPEIIEPWSAERAKIEFIRRFDELINRELYT